MASKDNLLIERLPPEDRRRLLARGVRVDLLLSQVLVMPGSATTHVYFPVEGFVSLLTVVSGQVGLEVGDGGREGLLGAHIALGVNATPLHALVQGQGSAWRLEAKAFSAELQRSATLRSEINRYLYVLMVQLATSAGCARYHAIVPRLARWLLMSQDRAQDSSFHMTQEFLGHMLGVRRVGITEAAGTLQRNGLISYQRGHLTVLDRSGLEGTACSCYAEGRASYAGQFA